MQAEDYFHLAPYNWNCAQAVHKAWQQHTGLDDKQIELLYRPMGGGRAPSGICGAIYAVQTIVGEGSPEAEALTRAFTERMGGLTCQELKGKHGRPCSTLVAEASKLLETHHNDLNSRTKS